MQLGLWNFPPAVNPAHIEISGLSEAKSNVVTGVYPEFLGLDRPRNAYWHPFKVIGQISPEFSNGTHLLLRELLRM